MKQGNTIHSLAQTRHCNEYYVRKAVKSLGITFPATKGDGQGSYLARIISPANTKRINAKVKGYNPPKVSY